MAWTEGIWEQSDSVFLTFPHIAATGVAEEVIFSDLPTIWTIKDDIFYGFPHIAATGVAEEYEEISGFSKIRMNNSVSNKIYYNGVPVNKVYYNGVLVFSTS